MYKVKVTGVCILKLVTFMLALTFATSSIAADTTSVDKKSSTTKANNKPPGGEGSAKDVVLRGDAACVKCHDEDQAYPVLRIGKTKHGVKVDKRTPTCTSCHGDSIAHSLKVKDDNRPRPDITYSEPRSATPMLERVKNDIQYAVSKAPERNTACLSCHRGGERIFWSGSTHSSQDIACNNCHQIHTANDRVRDKMTQTEICFSCHKDKRAEINRPSHHPIKEGKVTCSDCHNSHGTAGPKLLKRDTVNDTCYQCHMEKRGPFLHNHQPVNEECTLCHNPHGTTVTSMLKSRPPFLCQQCHNDISSGHPGQLGALPTAPSNSPSQLGTVGRGCLNCHTSIHGDNNPQGSTATRRFFR